MAERLVPEADPHLARGDHGVAVERHVLGPADDLLQLPDQRFFRRKGESAFQMVGVHGESFTDADEYLRYLARNLNDGYVASRDMRLYAETLRRVVAGELTVEQGVKAMPKLKRLGGTCPCSKSVRWVMEESNGAETTVMTRPA